MKLIKNAYDSTEMNDFDTTKGSVKEKILLWIDDTTGTFNVVDIDMDLGFKTPEAKNYRRVTLHRLMKDNYIESLGKRTGNYRKILIEESRIDWRNADINNTFDIELPFNIHNMVNIYPKNIIVVAGAPNAGKTGFFLNIVKDNMQKHDIFYFSSEMAEQEFKVRLSKFNDVKEDDWRFTPLSRSRDFADVIRPDDLNIIDYFEVSDNFYTIGDEFKKIYEKLNNGIAIIAIQKKKGAEYGRGAEFALEKPRLYITMDHGELKIVKAKNWKNPEVNPSAHTYNFTLAAGCKFKITNGLSL